MTQTSIIQLDPTYVQQSRYVVTIVTDADRREMRIIDNLIRFGYGERPRPRIPAAILRLAEMAADGVSVELPEPEPVAEPEPVPDASDVPHEVLRHRKYMRARRKKLSVKRAADRILLYKQHCGAAAGNEIPERSTSAWVRRFRHGESVAVKVGPNGALVLRREGQSAIVEAWRDGVMVQRDLLYTQRQVIEWGYKWADWSKQ